MTRNLGCIVQRGTKRPEEIPEQPSKEHDLLADGGIVAQWSEYLRA